MIFSASAFSDAASRSRLAALISFMAFFTCRVGRSMNGWMDKWVGR